MFLSTPKPIRHDRGVILFLIDSLSHKLPNLATIDNLQLTKVW